MSGDITLEIQEHQQKKKKYTGLIWPLKLRKLGREEVFERLKDEYSMVAGVAGLIAGFVFVVTTETIQWEHKGKLSRDGRTDTFGCFLILSLILSLISTTVATVFYELVNFLGKTPKLDKFLDNKLNAYVMRLPSTFLVGSIIVMLFGSSFAVGGLYANWVYYIYVSMASFLGGTLGIYSVLNLFYWENEIVEYLNTLKDFEKEN